MNKIFLIGNIASDVEKKQTNTGVVYCRFSLAVNRRFAKTEGEVDFFNVLCWRGLADTCANNLAKGKKVAVAGSIQINKYQAQDGTTKQQIEITADDVEFLSQRTGDKQPTAQDDAGVEDTEVGELPF